MLEFARTPMGRKFFDAQLPSLIKSLNKIGDELEKANNKPIGLTEEKHYKELIDAMIEYMCVAEKSSYVIKELLGMGFTPDELVNDYSFCDTDVERVVEEINMED